MILSGLGPSQNASKLNVIVDISISENTEKMLKLYIHFYAGSIINQNFILNFSGITKPLRALLKKKSYGLSLIL